MFRLGGTPAALQDVGLSALPITINQKHVKHVLNGSKDEAHSLGEPFLNALPKLIEQPIAITESQTQPSSSLVVFVEWTHQGEQIVVPLHVSGLSIQNGVEIGCTAIKSAFAKENALSKLLLDAIKKENAQQEVGIYYWTKQKSLSLLRTAGLQLPGILPADGLVHTIFNVGSPVKMRIEGQTQDQTQTISMYLLGAGIDDSGEVNYVAFAVNRFTKELLEINVLFALGVEKGNQPGSRPEDSTADALSPTDSFEITAAQLFENIKELLSDRLPMTQTSIKKQTRQQR